MTVVELLRVMDNPNLTEPQQQVVNIYTDGVYHGSVNGGYWKGTINEFLCKYDSGYYQNLGNAKVLKLTQTNYMEEFEPEIVAEDF